MASAASQPTVDFGGLVVAAFESRRAGDMESLIRRHHGVPRVAPSMREVPLEDDSAAVEFARRLLAGRIDCILLLTGVGTRALVDAASKYVLRNELLAAMAGTTVVARGPKPIAVLRELNVPIAHRVPEPNTWRELLELLDEHVPLEGRAVAVQEYGIPNPNLIHGLEARGAKVLPVPVYRWDLPADVGPLEETVRAVAAGEVDVLLFTSSMQVVHVVQVAARLGLEAEFRKAIARTVIGSIGPTASATLWSHGLPVDFEPEHPKMGQLVSTAARKAGALLEKKRRLVHWTASAAEAEVPPSELTRGLHESRLMRALRREPTDTTPVWIMRQAGRYMPEYRALREKVTFLELCKRPDLAAEVTVMAVDRLGVDAAIIFSDILPLLEPMGLDLEYAKGEGPVIHNPVRTAREIDRLAELESVEALDFVFQAIEHARVALPADVPLLGFAGAPFTLASYAIEGGASRSFQHTKTLMYRDSGAWHALLGRIVGSLIQYLNGQIVAGVQAVQLFDSWAGCLGPDDYRQFVLPHTRRIVEGLIPGVPLIQFATGNPALLSLLREAGGQCIGLDWRVDLGDAWRQVGYDVAVQGNLDPLVLFADRDEIRRRAKRILDRAAGRAGHVFNLGHGILPQTPVENAVALVDAVHEMGAR